MQPLRLLHTVSIIFLLIIFSQSTSAQTGNVGIGTAMPKARLHVADSAVLFSGPVTLPVNPSDPPVSGAGIRMMWYPQKAAFRVGGLASFPFFTTPFNTGPTRFWDNDSIGPFSFATGLNTKARGNYSFSSGLFSNALGSISVSMGSEAVALGDNSFSLGSRTIANSYKSVVIGNFNDTGLVSSRTAWVSTDPLFIVGNGDGSRSNAMKVMKNGNTDISGFTQLGSDAPAIKMKKYTITSSSSVGGTVQFAHGLNAAKILSVNAVLAYFSADDLIPPSYLDAAGFEYNVSITGGNVFIRNKAGNSSQVLNKQVRVTITYEE